MKLPKRLLMIVLTFALGLGVWTIAVTFTPTTSDFQAGETLSADDLNSLLNDNFNAVSDAFDDVDNELSGLDDRVSDNADDISDLDGRVSTNEGDISDLQDDKVDKSGDTMSGTLTIEPNDATAASFTNDSANDATVTIKNEGTGPVLQAFAAGGFGLVVGSNGEVQIGNAISGDVNITLDPEEGTITNNVGAGLPIAFATVDSNGDILSGTSNVNSVPQGGAGRYRFDITDRNLTEENITVTVTAQRDSGDPGRSTQWNVASDDLFIGIRDLADNGTDTPFSFIVFKAP